MSGQVLWKEDGMSTKNLHPRIEQCLEVLTPSPQDALVCLELVLPVGNDGQVCRSVEL